MHEMITEDDVKRIFKPTYYRRIPMPYVLDITITYNNGMVKKINKNNIYNELKAMKDGYIKIVDITDSANIEQTEISIDFKRIANHVNHSIIKIHELHAKKNGRPS